MLVLEVKVKHPTIVFLVHLRRVEVRRGDPANIHAYAEPRIAVLKDVADGRRVAVSRLDAVIVDRDLDVVLLRELLQVVPDLEVAGFDDNELHAHEFRELEQLAVLVLVERGAGNPVGVRVESAGLEDGLLASQFLLRLLLVVEMVGNQLQILDPMCLGERHHLIELQVSQGPGLDGNTLGEPLGADGKGGAGGQKQSGRDSKCTKIHG